MKIIKPLHMLVINPNQTKPTQTNPKQPKSPKPTQINLKQPKIVVCFDLGWFGLV